MNNKLDVLLICERSQGVTHVARKLEQLDCSCSFARNTGEVSSLLENHSFRLVLSTRPETEGSVLCAYCAEQIPSSSTHFPFKTITYGSKPSPNPVVGNPGRFFVRVNLCPS
jgi:hypothetical protein